MSNYEPSLLHTLSLKAAFICALTAPALGQTSGRPLPKNNTQSVTQNIVKPSTTQKKDTVLGYRAWSVDQSEIMNLDLWRNLVKRQNLLLQQPENRSIFKNFIEQLAPYHQSSLEEKMKAVDSLVDNALTYKSDVDKNNIRTDIWSSPVEILKAGTGDCDDFATLKYYALRHLDVPPEKIFLTVIEYPTCYHAIVVVDPGNTSQELPLVKPITPRIDSTEMAEVQKKTKTFYALNNSDGKNGRLLSFDVKKAEAALAMNEKAAWQFIKPK